MKRVYCIIQYFSIHILSYGIYTVFHTDTCMYVCMFLCIYFFILDFKEILPEVQSAIASATFISIDTEFSGLQIKDSPSINWYDSPVEAYGKLRKLAGVAVLQYGLCTFHEDPDAPNK